MARRLRGAVFSNERRPFSRSGFENLDVWADGVLEPHGPIICQKQLIAGSVTLCVAGNNKKSIVSFFPANQIEMESASKRCYRSVHWNVFSHPSGVHYGSKDAFKGSSLLAKCLR